MMQILSDIHKCNKTAWILPNYLAQATTKALKKSGKHSDVSFEAYTKPAILFGFLGANVPSSIIQRFSLIVNTGLFEWWPKLINRSDLKTGNDKTPPQKPNMFGNILVIFVLLGGGLSISSLCMILESWRLILVKCKICYNNMAKNLQNALSNIRPDKMVEIIDLHS